MKVVETCNQQSSNMKGDTISDNTLRLKVEGAELSSPCPHSRSGGRWIQQCMIKGSQGLETSSRLFDVNANCSPRDAWDVYCLCSPLLPLVGLLLLALITSPGQGHLEVPARLPTHTPRTHSRSGKVAMLNYLAV